MAPRLLGCAFNLVLIATVCGWSIILGTVYGKRFTYIECVYTQVIVLLKCLPNYVRTVAMPVTVSQCVNPAGQPSQQVRIGRWLK